MSLGRRWRRRRWRPRYRPEDPCEYCIQWGHMKREWLLALCAQSDGLVQPHVNVVTPVYSLDGFAGSDGASWDDPWGANAPWQGQRSNKRHRGVAWGYLPAAAPTSLNRLSRTPALCSSSISSRTSSRTTTSGSISSSRLTAAQARTAGMAEMVGRRRPNGVDRVVSSMGMGRWGVRGTSSYTLGMYMGAASGGATAITMQVLETTWTVA